jgi:hypothetical protein
MSGQPETGSLKCNNQQLHGIKSQQASYVPAIDCSTWNQNSWSIVDITGNIPFSEGKKKDRFDVDKYAAL